MSAHDEVEAARLHCLALAGTVRAMDGAAGASMDGFTAFLKMGLPPLATCAFSRLPVFSIW
ncbi:MAG TPA: hypothetical protein VMT49_00085 [Steroidobacteraceae bacterium]|nr:hypothetical protein [Steroidobacteraceae bacterium]